MKAVYTIEDLASRELLDAGADKPARLAVLGQPVAHSASPRMHQAALDELGIDARYIRIETSAEGLPEVVRRMVALGFTGANVTVPHKLAVMDCCDVIEPAARAMGAVNTLHFRSDGIHGFNTDAPGFRRAVEEEFGQNLGALKVLIVGAGGGAGQALAMSCVIAGVKHLVLANRTVDKLAPLCDRLADVASAPLKIIPLALDGPDLAAHARVCDLVVQASSVGLKPGDPPVLGADCLRSGQLVYDTIYQPAVTPLIALARSSGCRTANGLSMLLHQGALAFQIWNPGTEPLEAMRRGLAGA